MNVTTAQVTHAAQAADRKAQDFALGQVIKVKGEQGLFLVRGYGGDGSLTVYGGTAHHRAWRSFAPTRCTKKRKAIPAWKSGK